LLVISATFTYNAAVGSVNAMEGLELESSDGLLVNGTIDPYRGSAGGDYTFSVIVTNATASNYSVNVILFDLYTTQEVGNYSMAFAGTTAAGERYALTTEVAGQSLYSYRFVTDANGTWVSTFESYGPVHQSSLDIFIHFLPMYFFAMLVQVGLLFYLLLAFSWFSDRSKKQMDGADEAERDGAERRVPRSRTRRRCSCAPNAGRTSLPTPPSARSAERASRMSPQHRPRLGRAA